MNETTSWFSPFLTEKQCQRRQSKRIGFVFACLLQFCLLFLFVCGVSAQTEWISAEMTRGENSTAQSQSERNLNKPNPAWLMKTTTGCGNCGDEHTTFNQK